MHKAVENNDPDYEVIPETRGKVNNLFTLYSMSGDPEDFESLVDYDYETGLVTALMSTISTTEIAHFVNETEAFIDAVEGLTVDSPVGPVTMRACDHQATLPMFMGVTKKVAGYDFLMATDIVTIPGEEVMPSCEEIAESRK